MYEYGLNKVAYQITINPEELANNFEKRKQIAYPSLLRQAPNELSEEVSRNDVGYLTKPYDTLKAICKMVAAEYFYHPIIKAHLKRICLDRIYIVTEPTEKGKKTLNVYNYYYPTKRIIGKRIPSIKPELWMLITEAEKKGLIQLKFLMGHDRDKNWSDLKYKIERLVLDNRDYSGKIEQNHVDKWNSVRSRICDYLVKSYAKPNFEKNFRKSLTNAGKEAITEDIMKEFKQIINIKPYKPNNKNEDDMVENINYDEEEDTKCKSNNQQNPLLTFLRINISNKLEINN